MAGVLALNPGAEPGADLKPKGVLVESETALAFTPTPTMKAGFHVRVFVQSDGVAVQWTPTPKPPTSTPEPAKPQMLSGACPQVIHEALGWAGCAISWCESGWNPNATGAAGERGWFQVHPYYHPDATWDPYGNVRAAVRISSGGTDWSAWTTRGVLTTGYCPNGERPPI